MLKAHVTGCKVADCYFSLRSPFERLAHAERMNSAITLMCPFPWGKGWYEVSGLGDSRKNKNSEATRYNCCRASEFILIEIIEGGGDIG